MAEKKLSLFEKDKVLLQAKEGYSLPVRYKGAWVRVTKSEPVEFVVASLPYEAKIEIRAAIDAKNIIEVTAPTEKSAPKTQAKES